MAPAEAEAQEPGPMPTASSAQGSPAPGLRERLASSAGALTRMQGVATDFARIFSLAPAAQGTEAGCQRDGERECVGERNEERDGQRGTER